MDFVVCTPLIQSWAPKLKSSCLTHRSLVSFPCDRRWQVIVLFAIFPGNGGLVKGVSAESSVTPKEAKYSQGFWAQLHICHSEQERRTYLQKPLSKPSSMFGTQSATAKRGVHICQKTLQKCFFCWHLLFAIFLGKDRQEKGTQTQTFESGYFLVGWGSYT